jgi:hypothetical protein
MRSLLATDGAAGLKRYMADQAAAGGLVLGTASMMSLHRAVLFGAAGRVDDAFAQLDLALAFRDPALVHLAVAPQWDSLRGDPRFDERLKAMALPCAA